MEVSNSKIILANSFNVTDPIDGFRIKHSNKSCRGKTYFPRSSVAKFLRSVLLNTYKKPTSANVGLYDKSK